MEGLDKQEEGRSVEEQRLINVYDMIADCDEILKDSREVSDDNTTKVLALFHLLSNEKLTPEIAEALKDTPIGQSLGEEFIPPTTKTEETALVQKTQQQNSPYRRLLLAGYEPYDEKGQHSIKEEGKEYFLLLTFDKKHNSPYKVVGVEQIVAPEETAKKCEEILEREEGQLRERTEYLVKKTF